MGCQEKEVRKIVRQTLEAFGNGSDNEVAGVEFFYM